MKNALVIAALLIAAAAGGYVAQQKYATQSDSQQEIGELKDGQIDFSMADLSGEVRRLSDWHGEARIVNFWATWCVPCRREIPLLKKLQDQKAQFDLQVIGIAVEERDAVLAYAKDADFNYPILIGQEEAMAAAEMSGLDFVGLPFTLVLSADGDLVNAHIGEIKQHHVDQIVAVMQSLKKQDIDLESARNALNNL